MAPIPFVIWSKTIRTAAQKAFGINAHRKDRTATRRNFETIQRSVISLYILLYIYTEAFSEVVVNLLMLSK